MGQSSAPKSFPQPLPFGASPTNTVQQSQPVAQVPQNAQPFIPLNYTQQQQQPAPVSGPPQSPLQPAKNPFQGNPIAGGLLNRMQWSNYPQSF